MKNLSFLDKIMKNKGISNLISEFKDIYNKNREMAVKLINEKNISFPCFFVLIPQIEEYQLINKLKRKQFIALCVVKEMLIKPIMNTTYIKGKNKNTYLGLRWILKSGYKEVNIGEDYDKVIDLSFAILINTYKDLSLLPYLCELIFKRNRNDLNIHNLVWAIFESRHPYVLKLISDYLDSEDERDRELALKLLNIEDKKEISRRDYQNWLLENLPFLSFTGESFQYSSKPVFCRLEKLETGGL